MQHTLPDLPILMVSIPSAPAPYGQPRPELSISCVLNSQLRHGSRRSRGVAIYVRPMWKLEQAHGIPSCRISTTSCLRTRSNAALSAPGLIMPIPTESLEELSFASYTYSNSLFLVDHASRSFEWTKQWQLGERSGIGGHKSLNRSCTSLAFAFLRTSRIQTLFFPARDFTGRQILEVTLNISVPHKGVPVLGSLPQHDASQEILGSLLCTSFHGLGKSIKVRWKFS